MAGKLTTLTMVAGVLSIGGFVNYERNAALDAGLENRPYQDLSPQDLETLVLSYRAERDRARAWLAQDPEDLATGNDPAFGDLETRRKSFERFQEDVGRWRTRRNVVMEREAMLRQLEQERTIRREGLDRPLRRILRRVTRF